MLPIMNVQAIQTQLAKDKMREKRALARKKLIDEECKVLFADILQNEINKLKYKN